MKRHMVAQLTWIPLGAVLGFLLIGQFDVDPDAGGWVMLACLAASGASAIGIILLLDHRQKQQWIRSRNAR